MPEDKRPLPKPPSGRKRRFVDDEDKEELLADQMGMAMVSGKLDEFIDKEIGDNVNARKLTSMMMGFSGMSTDGLSVEGLSAGSAPMPPEAQEAGEAKAASTPPPEDIMKAAMSGDSKGLADMLKKEHLRRQGADPEGPEDTPGKAQHEPGEIEGLTQGDETPEESREAVMEKQVLVKLMKIASDNNVSIDWVINRALKLYVRDYEGTGRI